MKAQVFIARSEGGIVEVSVVRKGLSSGPGRKYKAIESVKDVLLEFGFDPAMIERELSNLSTTPPSVLLKFPETEIPDDALASLGFAGAAFTAA
jgi:hypothetical protein